MPNRKYQAGEAYRYGFNGKENDPETGTQDYGMRIYDGRIGKFLSVDPITAKYPHYSPYHFAGNGPIMNTDLDGLEENHYIRFQDENGNTVLGLSSTTDIIEKAYSVEIHSGTVFGFEIKYPVIVYTTLKNKSQEHHVHDLDDYAQFNSDLVPGPVEESVEFDTYQEATKVTDDDFYFTSGDAAVSAGEAGVQYMNRMEAGIGSTVKNSTKIFTKNWAITEWHHIIPKSLKKASNFVKKAVNSGFTVDGKFNKTPLAKYFKSTGLGVHGKHTKYTAQISNYLDNQNIASFTDKQAATFLSQLNRYILKQIKDNPKTKLNDLDLKLDKFVPK